MKQHWTKDNCKTCGILLPLREDGRKEFAGNECRKCASIKNDNRRRAKRTAAIQHLGDKCADCGDTFPEVCYDFHHIGEKKDAVANMVRKNLKLNTILEEASKCVLLCANCHRLRHFT